MNATRLPMKVLKLIEGEAMLTRVVNRVMRAEMVDDIVVATTTNKCDDAIVNLCNERGWFYYRGSEHDVLDRYYQASLRFKANAVVRITADCPLIDAGLMDAIIGKFISLSPNIDYACNILPRSYPRGLGVEVIDVGILESEWQSSLKWREHVTLNLRNNAGKFIIVNVSNEKDYSYMRWCVDIIEDLEFVRKVYGYFKDSEFNWMDVVRLLEKHPEWAIRDMQVDPK